jgi:hypothetical protein
VDVLNHFRSKHSRVWKLLIKHNRKKSIIEKIECEIYMNVLEKSTSGLNSSFFKMKYF